MERSAVREMIAEDLTLKKELTSMFEQLLRRITINMGIGIFCACIVTVVFVFYFTRPTKTDVLVFQAIQRERAALRIEREALRIEKENLNKK